MVNGFLRKARPLFKASGHQGFAKGAPVAGHFLSVPFSAFFVPGIKGEVKRGKGVRDRA